VIGWHSGPQSHFVPRALARALSLALLHLLPVQYTTHKSDPDILYYALYSHVPSN
jgi:hypothetical protein